MYISQGNVISTVAFMVFLFCGICNAAGGNHEYYAVDDRLSVEKPEFHPLAEETHTRPRRQTLEPAAPVSPTVPVPASVPAPAPVPTGATNLTDDSNRTVNVTTLTTAPSPPTPAVAVVTQIPLLGQNGTGILKVNVTNTPKVSEPILPDDNLSNVFKETPDAIKAEHNITSLKYDDHSFYNSTFIGNRSYFEEHWANITKQKADVHGLLSNSHRRATTLRLTFDFPFYGHGLRNITVATGGFIYTGEHVHNWLAATQYIAPLMANFDTTLTNDSYVKMYDDGEKFTAFWENVTLQEDITKKFTFAGTLYKNGDIVFAYKNIPIPVQNINDVDHPVKVGISDAYLTDRILFLIRRKTIYEYHRVSFKNYEITSNTLIKLKALPTCLQYDSCDTCVNHDTGFDCMWCEAIHKCSSGTDRNKQDWMLRNCDKAPISIAASCPARVQPDPPTHPDSTAYTTDEHHPASDVTIKTHKSGESGGPAASSNALPVHAKTEQQSHSAMGGMVAALVAVTLVCSAAAWALYAFKNPHTTSGQLLIKYRPSQWSWRRGEARYTAATIHM